MAARRKCSPGFLWLHCPRPSEKKVTTASCCNSGPLSTKLTLGPLGKRREGNPPVESSRSIPSLWLPRFQAFPRVPAHLFPLGKVIGRRSIGSRVCLSTFVLDGGNIQLPASILKQRSSAAQPKPPSRRMRWLRARPGEEARGTAWSSISWWLRRPDARSVVLSGSHGTPDRSLLRTASLSHRCVTASSCSPRRLERSSASSRHRQSSVVSQRDKFMASSPTMP